MRRPAQAKSPRSDRPKPDILAECRKRRRIRPLNDAKGGPMSFRAGLVICASLLAAGYADDVSAQDAAETAQILSGVGHSQGAASRSLGSAVSRRMNAANNAITATQQAGRTAPRSRPHLARVGAPTPSGGDLLEGTKAPTYKLGNGASIRVSGRMTRAPGTSCVKECPGEVVK